MQTTAIQKPPVLLAPYQSRLKPIRYLAEDFGPVESDDDDNDGGNFYTQEHQQLDDDDDDLTKPIGLKACFASGQRSKAFCGADNY